MLYFSPHTRLAVFEEMRLVVIGCPSPLTGALGDKLTRLISITDVLESGFVFIPEKAPWLDDFLLELTRFPNSKHDDQVDALTQVINWLKNDFRGFVRVVKKPDWMP